MVELIYFSVLLDGFYIDQVVRFHTDEFLVVMKLGPITRSTWVGEKSGDP